MKYRKHIRLSEYNYSNPGIYFLTICTWKRKQLFGKILDGKMILNEVGKIADISWNEIPNHFKNVELYAQVIMPNHVHGLIGLDYENSQSNPKIGNVIGSFKSSVTRKINQRRGEACLATTEKIWQTNYYEHIVRDENAFDQISDYILMNPENWNIDKENSDRTELNEFYMWIESYWKN